MTDEKKAVQNVIEALTEAGVDDDMIGFREGFNCLVSSILCVCACHLQVCPDSRTKFSLSQCLVSAFQN